MTIHLLPPNFNWENPIHTGASVQSTLRDDDMTSSHSLWYVAEEVGRRQSVRDKWLDLSRERAEGTCNTTPLD